jgi:hypothetical protein
LCDLVAKMPIAVVQDMTVVMVIRPTLTGSGKTMQNLQPLYPL